MMSLSKLVWSDYVIPHDILSKTVLQGARQATNDSRTPLPDDSREATSLTSNIKS